MHKRTSGALLTGAALFCRSGEWLPLWILLLSLLAGASMVGYCCSVLFGLAALGALAAHLSFFLRNPGAAVRLRGTVLVLTIAGGSGVLYLLTGRIVIPVFLVILTQCTVMAGADLPAEKLFPFGAYLGFASGTVLTALLLKAVSLPVPAALMFGAMCLISALYFLMRNQLMLQRMVNRRSRAEAQVPPDIRRGNLILVGGVLLILASLFLFRRPLLRLIDAVWELTVLVIGTVLRWIIRLISMLGGESPVQNGNDRPERIPNPTEESGGSSGLWMLLWVVVAAVILYFMRLVLAEWFYSLREAIAAWLQKLRRGRTVREYAGSAEYTDTETTALPETRKRTEKRKWKKEYAAWRRLPDDSRKFYAGYQLMLKAPAWEKGSLRNSDTVQEIQEKWARDYEPETLLCAVTSDFESDRYAEEGLPPAALKDMETVLESLRKAK